MRKTIHFHVYKSGDYYVADCAELPIVTQGKTLDETAENIKEATSLHLEGENLEELNIASNPIIELTFELQPVGDVA